MEVTIKKLTRTLQVYYGVFLLIAIFLFVAYEREWLQEGNFADDAGMQYILETIGILITIVFIPLSLKIYNLVIVKKIRNTTSLMEAMKQYRRWNEIRLLMLAVVVLPNIIIYFLTLNKTGGLCALIGITASFFCLPTIDKVKSELDIIKDTEI